MFVITRPGSSQSDILQPCAELLAQEHAELRLDRPVLGSLNQHNGRHRAREAIMA
jgi:hypothetical protein